MADDPSSVAHNPAAPASERFDATSELSRIYRPTASSIVPAHDMVEVIGMVQEHYAAVDMAKAAAGAKVIQFPGRDRPAPAHGMRSVYVDDIQTVAVGDYWEKPSPIAFEGLRDIVEQTPILAAVVSTRVRQVSRFCQISEDGGLGFEIRHVDRKHKLSGAEQEAAQVLAKFVANCGWEFNPRKRKKLNRQSFAQFMASSLRDSLAMDSNPIETEMKRNRGLGLDGFYAVDGSTIRLCSEDGYDGDDKIFALQVVQGRITTAYTLDQLIYEPRNPRADVRLAGYGFAEPEQMIKIITGFLNALTYNMKGFDENAIPKGLLQLYGDYGNDDIAAFKRYWNMMVKGVSNAHSLPVLISKDKESGATFEKFGVDFDEMYFSKWMTFLTSVICAIYGMDPTEINFESFSASQSSLSGSDTEEKLANSKDKGLLPLMSYYEALLTDFVITEFDEKFCFRWVGLADEDEKWSQESKKMILSVDELRAEQGYERWSSVNTEGPDMGGAPLNQSLIGPWMQAQRAAQQPQGGDQGDFGQPPAGGDSDAEGVAAQQPDGQPGTGSPDDASGDQPPPQDSADGGGGGGGEFGKALPTIYSIGD
jgi:hypothetical protein